MPSPSELAALAPVAVSVTSHAHAAEIEVVNTGYALVGRGVGELNLKLAPGQYQVRQRIGFAENIHEFEVAPGRTEPLSMELPRLEFASPIPLEGTALALPHAAHRALDVGHGTLRIVLRAPVLAGGKVATEQLEHLQAEADRLCVESFDGRSANALARVAADRLPGEFVASFELPPGPYVLVQEQEAHRRACMPFPVRPGRTTFVFALVLHQDTGSRIPMRLANATVVMLPTEQLVQPYEDSLLRLEAARKAMSSGGTAHGWANVTGVGPGSGELLSGVENTLLDLMDLNLALQSLVAPPDASSPEHASARERLERISTALGPDSADVLVLRHALGMPLGAGELAGPPLLTRSWRRLLSFEEGDARAGEIMPFAFEVEPSKVWFIWTEQRGARRLEEVNATAGNEVTRLATGASASPAANASPHLTESLDGTVEARPLARMLAQGVKSLWGTVSERLLGRRMPVVSFEDVESMLAELLKKEEFRKWMLHAKEVFEAEGGRVEDAAMRRLLSSLRMMSDPTLVDTLGAEAVAKSVLASVRLPRRQIKQLMKRVLFGVLMRLEPQDRAAMLMVMREVVDVAETWLKASPNLPPK
jgi:hypothetical protein